MLSPVDVHDERTLAVVLLRSGTPGQAAMRQTESPVLEEGTRKDFGAMKVSSLRMPVGALLVLQPIQQFPYFSHTLCQWVRHKGLVPTCLLPASLSLP